MRLIKPLFLAVLLSALNAGAQPASPPEQSRRLPGVIYPNPHLEAPSPPAPVSGEQLFLRASLDFRMNRFAEALQNVNSCLRIRKDWLPALRLRARVYSRLGKNKEAIADYTAILNHSPGDAEIYELRGESFLADNQRDRALEDYRHATDLDPHQTAAWLQLSRLYLSAGRLGLAQKAVERVIERTPDNIAAYQIRAQIEKERGDWKAELADLDRMLILEPANSWAKAYRPDVLLRIGHMGSQVKTDDTYEVYSAVLMHPVWDHADDDSLLLIAEETGVTYGGMDPTKCITAPAEYKTKLDQIFAAYRVRKSSNARLEPRFRINRPYKLLNAQECSQFADSRFREKQPSPELAELFKKTPDLIRVSPVFFSEDHTVAMVLVSNYCGGLCGGEKWRVLVKRNGAWLDRDWVSCWTVS